MGLILQRVHNTTSPDAQSGHVRALSAAPAGKAVGTRPSLLNSPHPQDTHASTSTRLTHLGHHPSQPPVR